MSYYVEIHSLYELLGDEGLLRLPSHLLKTYVLDSHRRQAIKVAVDFVRQGKNILIEGSPGTGKTALLFMILKELLNEYRIGYVLEGVSSLRNDHIEKGIILFYDDFPRMNKSALLSVFKNNVKGLIVTARSEEISVINRLYGIDVYEKFETIKVPPLSDEKLREMAVKYLNAEAIKVEDKEAINELIKKARGLPIYIWQVVRELKIRRENLTLEFARTIPVGMLDYVDNILWRILGGKEERYEAIITLLIMTDFVKYSVHQDLYNYIYMLAKEKRTKERVTIEDIAFDEVIEDITRYLSRDGLNYSFRIPHDSWTDVLKGKSNGPMAPEISRINILFDKDSRRSLVVEAAKRAWYETLRKVDDQLRIETFKNNIIINLGESFLENISENRYSSEANIKVSRKIQYRKDTTIDIHKYLDLLKMILSKNKIISIKVAARKINIELRELENLLSLSYFHVESKRKGYIYHKNFFVRALRNAKNIIQKRGKIDLVDLSKQVEIFPEDLQENLKGQFIIHNNMIYTVEEFTKSKIFGLALFSLQIALIADIITIFEFPTITYGSVSILNLSLITFIYFVFFYSLILVLEYINLSISKGKENTQIYLEKKRLIEILKKVLILPLILVPIIGWVIVLGYHSSKKSNRKHRKRKYR